MGETSEDLIRLARDSGFDVSATQIADWHRSGLLPRPRQVGLGRGRGTRSVYPVGTGQRLLALCEVHLAGGGKHLDRVAWRLWWDGHAVKMSGVREFLDRVAEEFDRIVRALRDPETGELSDAAWERLDRAATMRLDKPLARTRKRVGSGRFVTVLRVMYEIAAGVYDPAETAYDARETGTDRHLMEKAFGLDGALRPRLPGVTPVLGKGWLEETFGEDGWPLRGVVLADELAALSDEQLVQACDETRFVLDLFGGVSMVSDDLFGRGALGISVLGEAIRGMEDPERALWMLIWAVARFRGPEALRAELERNFRIEPELLEGVEHGKLLMRMKVEIPELAEALPPREFAAIAGNPERMECIREQHAKQLEVFFDAHPDYIYNEEEQEGAVPSFARIHEERR